MASQGGLGNLGEPPGSLLQTRNGGPGDQKPWRGLDASTRPRALRGDPERGKHARYRGTSDKRRTPRGSGGSRSVAYYRGTWGSETQATHGREGDVGQSIPAGTIHERDSELANRVTPPTGQYPRVADALPEEPDALIAHVRVCGRAGWVTTGSTRQHR